MFKIGDTVICKDAAESMGKLCAGTRYTILEIYTYPGPTCYLLAETGECLWYASRFEPEPEYEFEYLWVVKSKLLDKYWITASSYTEEKFIKLYGKYNTPIQPVISTCRAVRKACPCGRGASCKCSSEERQN